MYTGRYHAFIQDDNPGFVNTVGNNTSCEIPINQSTKEQNMLNHNHRRLNPGINSKPQKDFMTHPKVQPGNSNYASVTNLGKKVLILTDSICGRIKLRELNKNINNKHVYRKSFPGATPTELAHYCIPTLRDDQPDEVIIHIGTNSLFRDDNFKMVDEILNIVDICKRYGVNDVFVSEITYRNQYINNVYEVNNILRSKQFLNDFIFIDNENINPQHIWKDKIHLNDEGTSFLGNNFIRCLNYKSTN